MFISRIRCRIQRPVGTDRCLAVSYCATGTRAIVLHGQLAKGNGEGSYLITYSYADRERVTTQRPGVVAHPLLPNESSKIQVPTP